jgi:SPP1 family predicted phage head-tail adaptor
VNAGDLNRRIEVREPVETRSASGEVVVTYPNEGRRVWAQVLPLAGDKFFAADQVQSVVKYRIRVRYRHGYRSNQRVFFEAEPGKTQEFDIEAVLPIASDLTHLNLMCVLRESEGWR